MRKKQTATLVSRKYAKRGPFAETWHRMRKNPGAVFGLVVLSILILLMIYSFIFIDYRQATAMNPTERFQSPNASHIFGTDDVGRDLFMRTIYGTRYSLAVAFGAIAFGFIVGTFFGAIAGFFGGLFEEVIMRASDILASIPAMLLGMVIVTVLGNGLINLMLAVGVTSIPNFVRMTRAAVITIKGNEYIESSQAMGMADFRIVFTQVIPNGLSPLIVTVTTRMGSAIIEAASLSFLGFGVPIPTPEWGALVSAGRNFIKTAPYLTLFPGLFIMITTFACSLLGDGLRDALDPRLKR